MKSISKRIWLMVATALACMAMLGMAALSVFLPKEKVSAEKEVVTYSADWYTLTYDGDEVKLLLNADYHNWGDFTFSQFDQLVSEAKDIVSSLVEDKLLFADKQTAETQTFAARALPEGINLDDITGANVSGMLAEFLKGDAAKVQETIDLVLDGSYDNLLNYALDKVMDYVPAGYEVEDVKQDVAEIVTETLANRVAPETIASLNDKFADVVEKVSKTEEPFVLTAQDVLNALDGVTVDGNDVYTVGAGGAQIDTAGVKAMLKKLPRPSQVANYGPDDFIHVSYDVVVDTQFGDIPVKLTGGFEGDTAYLRKACGYIAQVFDVSSGADGYTVNVNVPQISAGKLLRLTTTAAFSDEVKDFAFEATDMTAAELNAYVQDMSVAKLQSLLKGVDYQKIASALVDADKLSSALGVNVTQAQLDKALDFALKLAHKDVDAARDSIEKFLAQYIDGFRLPEEVDKLIAAFKKIQPKIPETAAALKELVAKDTFNASIAKYIDKIGDYESYIATAKRALQKLVSVLPERFADQSLFDLIDAERVVASAKGLDVSLSKISDYISRLSAGLGDKLSPLFDKLIALVGDPSVTLNVIVDLPLDGVHKVTFNADETTQGLLPAGADLFAFGAAEKNGKEIVGWVDENGTAYETMPETDVELFAVTGFTAAMANVEKTYDGKTAKLEVVTEGEGYTFTYAWKKDGVATGDTGSFIEVANVSDSGAYTCMITGTGEHGDVYTKEVTANVAIAKAANSVSNPTMEGWTYGDAANEPSATATFGTVAYRYYNETETLLDGVPANAGTYFVKAYVAADANGNYDAAESELVKFTVAKAANSVTVTVSGWTYDGTAHQATATAAHGTPVITYYAEDDTPLTAAPVNAGNYYVVASVAATDNYTAAEATQDFTVAKRGLDFANAEWNSLSFTYDKSEKSVTFDKDAVVIADFTGTLDFGFAYKETGYTYRATDAGSYKAGFTYDVVNFAAANLGEKADTLWNIAKAQIIVDKDALDVSITQTGAEPSDNLEVPYNGKEYAVSVSAPEGVTVTMSGEYKKTAAGSYVAVATFSLKDGKNYTLSCDTEMEIEWKIKETVTPPDRTHEALDGKVSVTDGTGAADGYELTASDVTATLGDVDLSAALEEGQKGTVKAAYDIHFEDGGTEKPVTGNFSVKLLIPENLRSAENLMVVHIADDGTVTAMDATRNGNYMEFTAEHFSVYAIVQTEADAPASMWWLYVLIAVIVIIIIIVIILLLRKKKDNGDDGEPAPEEEPAKELAEEPAEEAEETAEEPEQPAEEATEEEAPVPEEEPAEEPEVPEEEPESEPEEGDGADMNGALFVAAADADKREVFDRSYFSRLAQAEDELKDYYYALRAKLLSYRKMTNRVSWNYESFNRGRMQCVKLKIRGKSLVMYIALDPKELNVNKYHHQDVSETAKYAEVPTMMKIRSPRGLKYAMELVDLLLGQKLNLGVKKMQPEAVEIPYASDETLLEQGYIKVQYTTFGFGKKN